MGTRLVGALLAMVLGAGMAGAAEARQGPAITLYSEPNFRGDTVTLRRDVSNFDHMPPWNDRAQSLVVHSGTWEVCKHKDYQKCRTLVAGSSIAHLGEVRYLREISSARVLEVHHGPRPGDGWRPPPPHHPPPPPQHRPPPRWNDDIVWDNPRPSRPPQLSACQQSVYDGFLDRFGRHAQVRFDGQRNDGTIWWNGNPWRYRCAHGQINIWQEGGRWGGGW